MKSSERVCDSIHLKNLVQANHPTPWENRVVAHGFWQTYNRRGQPSVPGDGGTLVPRFSWTPLGLGWWWRWWGARAMPIPFWRPSLSMAKKGGNNSGGWSGDSDGRRRWWNIVSVAGGAVGEKGIAASIENGDVRVSAVWLTVGRGRMKYRHEKCLLGSKPTLSWGLVWGQKVCSSSAT
jgi:hypothetical protein